MTMSASDNDYDDDIWLDNRGSLGTRSTYH